jgi:hypothetical protein
MAHDTVGETGRVAVQLNGVARVLKVVALAGILPVGQGVIVIDHLHEGASAQAAFEGIPQRLGALIEQEPMGLTEACEHVLAHVRLHMDADGKGLGHRKDAPVHADAKE